MWQESLYDLWCKKSNFAVLYPSSYGPVANARGITTVNVAKTNTSTGISKNNAVFIWDTTRTVPPLNMTTIATTSVFHILLESNRLFMRNQT